MNTRSLRFRLVLWYALSLGLVFVITGSLLYFGVDRYLEGNLTRAENSRAVRICALAQRLEDAPAARYAAEIATDFAPEASGRFIRISRTHGPVIYQSGAPIDGSFDPAQIGAPPEIPGIRREKLLGGQEMMFATMAIGSSPDRMLV
jgi:hypothetical protein